MKSIKSYLVEGETIQFKNIGELILNSDGNIVFAPADHINYLTDAFGFTGTDPWQQRLSGVTTTREVDQILSATDV